MTAPSEELLMRYFDGELDAAEAREVEIWLEGSTEGRAAVTSFERVGDALRAISGDVGTRGDGIADAVMARLGQSAAPQPRAVFGERRAQRAPDRRWLTLMPALGLGLAAAAAVAIYMKRPVPSIALRTGASVTLPAERPTPLPSVASSEALALAAEGDVGQGASIESVDFGAVAGTIFMVPSGQSADETETPVVWLMDDSAPDEGRMAPL